MAEWQTMDKAPRDKLVRLFLPCVKWEPDERGNPKPGTVEHAECNGAWDTKVSHWVDVDVDRKVYPSQWKPIEA